MQLDLDLEKKRKKKKKEWEKSVAQQSWFIQTEVEWSGILQSALILRDLSI